jgi:hypothetical protein
VRLLLTADWHLSANPRDDYRFAAVDEVRKIAVEQQVEHLFVLGDMTDRAGPHSAAFTNRVVETLAAFTAHCPVTIVRGTASHDGDDPATPFFRFVNAIPDLRYVTDIDYWQWKKFRVMLVPCGLWPERLPAVSAVFTHATFAGARAEHDVSLGGLRLPMTDIPIYSGDVHVPQRHGPVVYVGAPTLIRFGDAYKPRVILLDLYLRVGRTYWSIPVKGPTKRLVEVLAYPDGRLGWDDLTKLGKGDIVKVRVRFAGAPPPLSHVSSEIHAKLQALGVAIHAVEPVVERRDTVMPRTPVSRSDRDLVVQYGKAHHLDAATIEAGLGIVAKPRTR